MAYIEMPKLSDTMTEGTLVKWRKNSGDKISVGDVIAEVETDKATMEMEAFDDGVLGELLVQEGQAVKLGEKMAVLILDGEDASTAAAAPNAAPSTPSAPAAAKPAPQAAATPLVGSDGGRLRISPLARKIAQESGIHPAGISGTGPGGRIVKRDILEQGSAAPKASAPASSPAVSTPAREVSTAPAAPVAGASTRIPLTNMRRVIAERLLASKTQIPHFYLNIEVDAGPLMKLRSQLNAAAEEEGVKFTVNDLVLKAAVLAAVQEPRVNASFTPDAVIQFGSVHLAVAVAVEDGLVTPVIRDAQTKSLREINAAVKDLAGRAKNKKLKPEEFQGGTITVSNLGAFGIDSFSAIINPPQAMILAVGSIIKKPVVAPDDSIVVGQRLSIGLSCDHRVVDGAVGASYLASLRKFIENPTLMLILTPPGFVEWAIHLVDPPSDDRLESLAREKAGLDAGLRLLEQATTPLKHMKALIFTNEYPPNIYGGAGVHVEFLCRELAKRIQVDVRCFGTQDVPGDMLRVRGYGAETSAFGCPDWLKGLFATLQRNVAMNAEGIDADIAHCHTWYAHFAGVVAKLTYGIPLVITVHSLEPLRPWKREQLQGGYDFSSWVEKTAMEMADAVVAVSEGTRKDILRLFDIPAERVRVIFNGIDPVEFQPTRNDEVLRRYGVDPTIPFVLFVGRITRQKGIIHLVRAAGLLDPQYQVVLCAGAPDTPEIAAEMEAAVAELQRSRPNVIWIREMLPTADKIVLYSHAQVFCCPSIYEPFGIINLEAMACETAVVASAVGGIPEVVVHEETGLLVPVTQQNEAPFEATDPQQFAADLAAAVLRLLEDRELAARMGAAGRSRVLEMFSWDAIAGQTTDLYHELLDGRHREP